MHGIPLHKQESRRAVAELTQEQSGEIRMNPQWILKCILHVEVQNIIFSKTVLFRATQIIQKGV